MNHVEEASNPATATTVLPERDDRHYIADLLVFQVETRLFRIPVNVLRGSPYFRDMLDAEYTGGPKEGNSDEIPIVLHGILSKELKGFLDVLFARLIDGPISLDLDQLSAALHLSTMWSFDGVRAYTIDQIESRFGSQDPFDRLDLAFKCDVDKWRLPAYTTMCEREEHLTADEGARLGFSRLSAICRLREKRWRAGMQRKSCGDCKYCDRGKTSDCHRPTSVIAFNAWNEIQGTSDLPLQSSIY